MSPVEYAELRAAMLPAVEPEVALPVLGADLNTALVLVDADRRMLGEAEALRLFKSAVRVAIARAGL